MDSSQVDSPKMNSPKMNSSKMDSPKMDSSQVDSPNVDSPNVDSPNVDSPNVDSPNVDSSKMDSLKMDSPKLHICFVSKNLPLAKTTHDQQSLWPITDRLSEMGHRISVISHKTASGHPKFERGNTTIYSMSNKEQFASIQEFSKLAEKKLLDIHKEHPIDHIHSLDAPLKNFKKLWSKKKKNQHPYLSYGIQSTSIEQAFSLFSSIKTTAYGLFLSTFIYPISFLKNYFLKDYFTLKQAQAVFVSSPKQALALERYYLYPPENIFQVPLDSFMISLMPRSKSSTLLESLNLSSDDAPIVATASEMNRPDDLYFLLDIFEKISLAYPKARFLIIGDGPYFKDIEKRVLLKILDSKVIMTRNVPSDSLSDFIGLSDIFINLNPLASGLGRTLVEAMAQKKVIIGSELSPISTIIENGVNGYLIRPGETQRCINLINSLFDDPEKRSQLGEKARKDVLNIFDQDLLTKKILSAFQKIRQRKTLFKQIFFN